MTINFLAVILGAVFNIVFARVWYGLLFKDLWRKLTNRTANEKPSQLQMMVAGALALAMAFGVNIVVSVVGIDTYFSAILAGLIIGGFFVKPVVIGEWIWDKKPYALVVMNASFYVLYFILTFMLFVALK